MISRTLLLRQLTLIAPAVSNDDLIPILRHFCFTGTYVMAFNDRIALSTPRQTEFTGTIPAAGLVDLLRTSRAAVVELISCGRNMAVMKLGRSRLEFVSYPREAFSAFTALPTIPRRNYIRGVAGKFFSAVEHCLRSVNNQTVRTSEELGITVIPRGDKLLLYSTDRGTISHAPVTGTTATKLTKPFILSADFCRQMLRLAELSQTHRLEIKEKDAVFAGDDTMLMGRVIAPSGIVDLEALLNRQFADVRSLIEIPKSKLGPILERAAITGNLTRVTISHGSKATFQTYIEHPDRGIRVTDTTLLRGHPDVEVSISAQLLQPAYRDFDKIIFAERCVIFARGSLLYLVARRQ